MMSRKKKILIIIHLIFTFSLLSWLVMKPLVMGVVARKSEKALYEMVLEREALVRALPAEEQTALREGYATAGTTTSPYRFETSPFALAWIFFSIVICLLLLFNIEGAVAACWLLPALVIGYAYFSYATPPPQPAGLFPSERYVLEHYANASLSGREQLLKGWHTYLVHEWAHEEPSATDFDAQVERGLFAFNVARLKSIRAGQGDEVVLAGFASPPSIVRILSYFVWNLVFAWLITRSKSVPQSNPS